MIVSLLIFRIVGSSEWQLGVLLEHGKSNVLVDGDAKVVTSPIAETRSRTFITETA